MIPTKNSSDKHHFGGTHIWWHVCVRLIEKYFIFYRKKYTSFQLSVIFQLIWAIASADLVCFCEYVRVLDMRVLFMFSFN
jgi:hypothetical protein